MLSDTYGDFFLAELIEAQDDLNHAIVGLSGQSAVSLIFSSQQSILNLALTAYR